MTARAPIAELDTHEVFNMPPLAADQDLWTDDTALRHWADVMGGDVHHQALHQAGLAAGSNTTFELADQANRHGPELRAFDRNGMRINAVQFHPAYHDLMAMAINHRAHGFAWANEGNAGHVGQSALFYMFCQPEGGVMCPMAMAYSVVPSLRSTPEIERAWMPKLLSTRYDKRDIPVSEKTGAMLGMFMTEKQGGSDVRTNSTVAVPASAQTGIGANYLITGHKFFCSAPMSDAFLILAKTDEHSISCFLVPRWRPDGSRNNLMLMRLKDKLGNRSNASSEMEFRNTYGVMIGQEGRGIRTILDMVTGNRLYCAMSSAGIMRQALVQALHHTRHRKVFGKLLIDQPLMKNVLADMAIEVEASVALGLRIARAMDHPDNPTETALARIGTAVAKFWNTKRCPSLVVEALECHGGPGYIEESIMPRLHRESPLNSIWEGSGNIMGLDVMRAMGREHETLEAFLAEVETARGRDRNLDQAIDRLKDDVGNTKDLESRMRTITEQMALTLQGALLTAHAPDSVASAFCQSRLAPRFTGAFGTLPAGLDLDAIIQRALPA
ncbi:MAG: acyl-CoA dehydrogenase family protein [Burkholderiaceae bacterium]